MLTIKTLEKNERKMVEEIEKRYHVTVDEVEIYAEPGTDGRMLYTVRMSNDTTNVQARFTNAKTRIDIIVMGENIAGYRELRWRFHDDEADRVEWLVRLFGDCLTQY